MIMRFATQLAGIVSVFACIAILYIISVSVTHADPVIQNCGTDARYCTTSFVPLENFSGSRKLADAYNTPELGPFIQKLFVGAISLGAILAVLRLAYAGFVYMSSDLPGLKSNSKEIIWDTLLGLFLLLAIYLILYQINPDILSLNVTRNITPAPDQQNSGYSGFTADEAQRAGTFGVPLQDTTPGQDINSGINY